VDDAFRNGAAVFFKGESSAIGVGGNTMPRKEAFQVKNQQKTMLDTTGGGKGGHQPSSFNDEVVAIGNEGGRAGRKESVLDIVPGQAGSLNEKIGGTKNCKGGGEARRKGRCSLLNGGERRGLRKHLPWAQAWLIRRDFKGAQ